MNIKVFLLWPVAVIAELLSGYGGGSKLANWIADRSPGSTDGVIGQTQKQADEDYAREHAKDDI